MWLRRAALAGGACTALSIGEGVRRTWGVEACEVPVGSNLDYIGSKQTVWHQDCYKLSIPIDSLPKKSLVRLTDSFCSAFFRSWPMQRERQLIARMTGKETNDEVIDNLDYVENDVVSEFRVICRGSADVLFDSYNSFAFTWLGVGLNVQDRCLEFKLGSALTGAGYRGVPLQEYIMYQMAMPFHRFYSRLLLKQAVALMLTEHRK